MLLFKAIANSWDLTVDLNRVEYLPRNLCPDLLSKFLLISITLPWILDKNLVEEHLPDDGKNRGIVRIYKNSQAEIQSVAVIFGDSHSYSGLASIMSQFFSEVRFCWCNPSTLIYRFC